MARGTGTSSPYFASATVDAFVVAGMSVAWYLMFRLVPSTMTSPSVIAVETWLVWLVSYPHFVASSIRLYGARSTLGQYPLTAAVTPLLFVGAVVVAFASPATFAPAFVKLFLLWSPYHFSGQTIGLTVLYARRSGIRLDPWLRRAITGLAYLTCLYAAARLEVGGRGQRFYGVVAPSLDLPSWLPRVLAVAIWLDATALALLVTLRWGRGEGLVPWIVLLPIATQCLWFATTPIPAYRNMVFCFHSLQYLFVAWNAHLREGLSGDRLPGLGYASRRTVVWYASAVAGGGLLFWVVPRLVAHGSRSLAFTSAVVFVAIETHHFFVDGVIWRLRHRRVAAPLASSLGEIVGRRPLTAAT